MDDTGIMREICSNLLSRLDAFLGIEDVTGSENIKGDKIFITTCDIVDTYKPGYNTETKIVVHRVNHSYWGFSDPGWKFFFKDCTDISVAIRRHGNQYWISFIDKILVGSDSTSRAEEYKIFRMSLEDGFDGLRTCFIHFIKILSLAYVMCKRRKYGMDRWIVYDSITQSCIVVFHGEKCDIQIEMQLNSEVENTAVALKRYCKRGLNREEWKASEKDLPASFVDLNAFEEYVKAH